VVLIAVSGFFTFPLCELRPPRIAGLFGGHTGKGSTRYGISREPPEVCEELRVAESAVEDV
jgi:hypothetical protein